MHLSAVVMQHKDCAIIALFSAVLPWTAVQSIVLASAYGPLFWGLLGPSTSKTGQQAILYSHWVFEALVFSIPVAAVLAWLTTAKPALLAVAITIGYSAAFFSWGLIDSLSIPSLINSYIAPSHLMLIFVLWVCVYVLRWMFIRNAHSAA